LNLQEEQWAADDYTSERERRRSNCRLWALHHEKLAEQVVSEAQERAAMHRQKAQGYRDMLVNDSIPEPSMRGGFARDPWS